MILENFVVFSQTKKTMEIIEVSPEDFLKGHIQKLNTDIKHVNVISDDDLDRILKYSEQNYYYAEDELTDLELLKDEIYDQLKRLQIAKKKLDGQEIDDLEHVPENNDRMIELPIHMGSCTKINHGTGQTKTWLNKFSGPYVISPKWDGVSGLYYIKDGQQRLFSRGKGNKGQDITELLKYINLPKIDENIMIRGELIISKDIFNDMFKKSDDIPDGFKNSRNAIAGIINRLGARAVKGSKVSESSFSSIQISLMKNIDFMVYEYIDIKYEDETGHIRNYIEQYEALKELFPEHATYSVVEEIDDDILSKLFDEHQESISYEIDGLVIADASPESDYERPTEKNPEYTRAYKKVLETLSKITTVKRVVYKTSKEGFAKPVVEFQTPIEVDNVTVSRASGYNGKFIKENCIGPGAVVKVTRSGGVIPKIIEVITPADEPDLPDKKFRWNESNVELIIEFGDDNPFSEERRDMNIKQLHHFLTKIGTKGVGEKNVGKMYDGGIRTISDLILLKRDELSMFAQKTGDNIHKTITECVANMTIVELIAGSGIFGKLFSTKRIQILLEKYPNFFRLPDVVNCNTDQIVKLVIGIEGFAQKTSQEFANNMEKALEFFDNLEADGVDMEALLDNKKIVKTSDSNSNIGLVEELQNADKNVNINGMNINCTGFRDPKITNFIEKNGGKIQSAVNGKTDLVIVKNEETSNKKVETAREKEIPILTKEEFIAKYMQ